jgi:hypothetical protein
VSSRQRRSSCASGSSVLGMLGWSLLDLDDHH